MLAENLMRAGLLKNEAKVYLALAELGSGSATEIAKNTDIQRPNVYLALQGLLRKGLINYIEKEKGRVYEAGEPKALLNLLEAKQEEIKKIIPVLEVKRHTAKSARGTAHVFEGMSAIYSIFNSFLELKQPILAYGIPKEAMQRMKPFIGGFHKKRMAKKIVMKHIYNHNVQERIKELNMMQYTEARYLPPQFDSLVSTNICGNQTVLIHWTATPLAVQIQDKDLADVYTNYFNLLWQSAKK